MIDTVLEALKELHIVRPEGIDAEALPVLCVHALRDEIRYRADGQDFVRTVHCQLDALGKTREQADRLQRQARDVLTGAPYHYCCESV